MQRCRIVIVATAAVILSHTFTMSVTVRHDSKQRRCDAQNSSDASLLDKIRRQIANNPAQRHLLSIPIRSNAQFVIVHFAGTVCYEAAGFLEKNKGTRLP